MELQILDFIQTLRTPAGDVIMPFLSWLGDNGMIWIVLALLLMAFRKTRKAGFMVSSALILDLVLCTLILKHVVPRVRPCDVNLAITLLVERPTDYSFPSGHAAASFAAVTALFLAGKKKMGVAALILSVLISFSRLYLYVHYPSDVLCGVILGILCGWLGYFIVDKVLKKSPGIRKCCS